MSAEAPSPLGKPKVFGVSDQFTGRRASHVVRQEAYPPLLKSSVIKGVFSYPFL
jgi:hypothetical protein